MKNISILLAVITLVGCATSLAPSLPTYEISAPFNSEEAFRLTKEGNNTIKGNAFMRQKGGGVVTCAGQTVYLVPATEYARQRFLALYDTIESGVNAARKNYRFVPDPPEYYSIARTTKCDSQGNFSFERTADGEFFITVLVSWSVGNSAQGGNMMHRVSVRGGQTLSIVMAP